MVEEGSHLCGAHGAGVSRAVVEDEAADPVTVGALCSCAVVATPQRQADEVEQLGRGGVRVSLGGDLLASRGIRMTTVPAMKSWRERRWLSARSMSRSLQSQAALAAFAQWPQIGSAASSKLAVSRQPWFQAASGTRAAAISIEVVVRAVKAILTLSRSKASRHEMGRPVVVTTAMRAATLPMVWPRCACMTTR